MPSGRGDAGVDVAAGEAFGDSFAELLASCLASKGFCTIDLGLDQKIASKALDDVSALKAAGRFYRPPELIAEGLLGTEGSAQVAELQAPALEPGAAPDGQGLREVDGLMSRVGVELSPHFDLLGFEFSHRSNAIVHEAGIPGEGPALSEGDVTKWLEKFLRHNVMVLVFLGPMEGALKLKVYEEDAADAHEVPTPPGRMVVLRPDLLSHQHVALGKAVVVSSFFVHAHAFQKRHATGGWIMCPVARELDKWAMERAKALKAQMKEGASWDPAVPKAFQQAANQSYFKGNMVGIRGLSCRFPVNWEADHYFRSLTGGPDYVIEVPIIRWDHSQWYDDSAEAWKFAKTNVRHGAFMEGVDLFDNKIFTLSVSESRGMDPHQRVIMEVGYDALYRMGMSKKTLMNSSGSVYVGHSFGDWGFVEKCADCSGCGPTGGAGCVAANRLSFVMGMKGPSMALDTDQSSSLTAIFMTAESVQPKGRSLTSDLGVGIGAQLMLSPTWWAQHGALGWLSRRGRCMAFDACASGFVRGEGCAAASLKPLCELVDGKYVQEEKYPVVGVLAGVSLNTNGKCANMSTPNGVAEQEVIHDAVRHAGVEPGDIDAVEAHGAGLFLADAIEVGSHLRAARIDSDAPLCVTSVKTIVGNLMECGGIAALQKIVLGSRWGFMACGLHLREVNPHMDVVDNPVALLTEHLSYPRQASFNGALSQGFGGTNVYCLTWGKLDEQRLPAAPGFPAEHQRIQFWPGGGGFLDAAERPERGYYIVGSWSEWGGPQLMEDEGGGAYGCTVTLGENSWESFQIWLDGHPQRVLHPGMVQARRDTAACGPHEEAEVFTWLIDGRCEQARLPAVRDAGADEGGEVQDQLVPLEHMDMGKPGDQYHVRLHIAGKWRLVTWEKEKEAPPRDDGAFPPESVGKYYIVSSWNGWDYEELKPDPGAKGLFYTEVTLKWGSGSFQIVRNRDVFQVLYPSEHNAAEDALVFGPDEAIEDLRWFIDGRGGDTFRVEFQRLWEGGKDVKKVSWRLISSDRPS